jgi:hypothetical protein
MVNSSLPDLFLDNFEYLLHKCIIRLSKSSSQVTLIFI